jgi:hypothetical protein
MLSQREIDKANFNEASASGGGNLWVKGALSYSKQVGGLKRVWGSLGEHEL